MTAKEFLNQYRAAERNANQYRSEYAGQLAMIDAVRSVSAGDGTPSGSGIGRPTELKAVRLVECAERYRDALLDAVRIRQEVFGVIEQLPDDVRPIMYERYICLKKWHEVADAVHYSERQCCKLHQKGLRYVEEFLEVQYNV